MRRAFNDTCLPRMARYQMTAYRTRGGISEAVT
jgi:hypothetical protein